MKKIDKIKNIQKANLITEQIYLKNKGIISEEGHFNLRDLMSLPSMNLSDQQINTLEGIVNLIHADRDFCEKLYPNGNNASDIINDIKTVVGSRDFGEMLDQMSGGNPVSWANKFKLAISKRKQSR